MLQNLESSKETLKKTDRAKEMLPKPKFRKTPLIIGLAVLLSVGSFFLGSATQINAQPALLDPCEERGAEYHSLRPYPAEPCNEEVEDTALFCGNQLVLQDTVSSENASCQTLENGDLKCTVINKTKNITIDLSEAEFPILGNTDDVKRVGSEPSDNDLDDAAKTNEYVSWYLNGVAWKAEYPPYDPNSPEGQSKTVDFSGPLNKLLPWEVQMRKKYETVTKASETRHDQIVGCMDLTNNKIVQCGENSIAKNEIRLSHLAEKGEPPYPSEYDDAQEYWQDYRKWIGHRCLSFPDFPDNILGIPLPIPNIAQLDVSYCFDDPSRSNIASLYSHIPYSSTEDRVGQVSTSTFNVQEASEDLQITNISFDNQQPAELFFAHTEESAELLELLQGTYVSGGEAKTGATTGVSPTETCDLVNIRTSEHGGDDLHAGEITGNLTYSAEFTCEGTASAPPACYEDCLAEGNTPTECRGLPVCGNQEEEEEQEACTKNVNVTLSLETETPEADEIWQRGVAGPTSVFKRIFPKVGVGGPILGILDIPAATNVVYSSGDGTPITAGNPKNQRSGEGAELYFPHIGSVQEYFLTGIQTMLRPKGFGEQIQSGELAPGSCSDPGSLPSLSGSSSCGLCNTGDLSGYLGRFGYSELPPTMVNILEAAGSEYDVPASLLLGILYAEGGLERYEWTEELAQEASVCGGQVPNCSTYNVSSTGAVGPFQWIPSHFDEFADAAQAVDSSREGDPCNLMDAAFAAAKKAHLERGGATSYSPAQCNGITYNTAGDGRGVSTSCSDWNDGDAATVARQYAGQCVPGYQDGVVNFFNSYQCQ